MAVLEVDVSGTLKKFAGAIIAALMALPQMMLAQAHRISNDWLTLRPANPRDGIPRDNRVSVEQAGDGSTTIAIERRAEPRPDDAVGQAAYAASQRDTHLHVVVSLQDRKLWVVVGADTVLEAPVAVGSGQTLEFGSREWTFDTPRGIRTIRGKDADPHWIPPEWHYAETAQEYGLRVATLSLTRPTPISGGRRIEFRDGMAGVVEPDSGFAFLPLEEEIVFDSTLFVPPVGSKNRTVQGELGKYKLDTGGGVLLHGTPHQTSIGKAATHGCMRLRDEDIEWLYQYVPVGTKLYIY
jgi:lipoprotein-anchoring transpeptidase ErfK/SrfK